MGRNEMKPREDSNLAHNDLKKERVEIGVLMPCFDC
jgi:hypothetical protein